MENRFQYFLLILARVGVALTIVLATAVQADKKQKRVDSEFLEIGANVGLINIEDFPSDYALGLNMTFRATEDFFLQLNYMQASDVDLSSAESQGATSFIADANRDFTHYDLLLGVNLFQGEFFSEDSASNLSSLHFVFGVGETEFGDESNFSYTVGLGYRVAFNRRYIVSFDVRDYIYRSSLVAEDSTTNNIHTSLGIGYLF